MGLSLTPRGVASVCPSLSVRATGNLWAASPVCGPGLGRGARAPSIRGVPGAVRWEATAGVRSVHPGRRLAGGVGQEGGGHPQAHSPGDPPLGPPRTLRCPWLLRPLLGSGDGVGQEDVGTGSGHRGQGLSSFSCQLWRLVGRAGGGPESVAWSQDLRPWEPAEDQHLPYSPSAWPHEPQPTSAGASGSL